MQHKTSAFIADEQKISTVYLTIQGDGASRYEALSKKNEKDMKQLNRKIKDQFSKNNQI